MEDLGNLPIPIPPPEEVTEIVAYLEKYSTLWLGLLVDAEHSVRLLQERRTALISAAVTGKIDVRGMAKEQTA
jgi:type I restriction enzyme S subunit